MNRSTGLYSIRRCIKALWGFIIDNSPWLKQTLEELGLLYNTESPLEMEA